MQIFTALLVDHESHCLSMLQAQLGWTELPVKVVATAGSVPEAANYLQRNTLDFIFLDVKMPRSDGFDLFDFIRIDFSDVILTTVHDEFALKAFRHRASGYLLKPISLRELKPLMQSLIKKRRVSAVISPKILEVTVAAKHYRIPHSEIIYFASKGSYSLIKLSDGQEIRTSFHLKKLAERLNSQAFFRIHHQYVVNTDKVSFINRIKNTSVALVNGETLPVSRTKKAAFIAHFAESKVIDRSE